MVQHIGLDDVVDAHVDASLRLVDSLVGFLVGPDHVEPDAIVLCD